MILHDPAENLPDCFIIGYYRINCSTRLSPTE